MDDEKASANGPGILDSVCEEDISYHPRRKSTANRSRNCFPCAEKYTSLHIGSLTNSSSTRLFLVGKRALLNFITVY
jgi:hypothetical protein